MNQILDKYLCEKYPKIFSERSKSPRESCMHWGLECGDGWFSIIDSLCYSIQRHVDNPPYQPVKGWRKFTGNAKKLWNLTVWNKIVYPWAVDLPYDKYVKHARRWQFSSCQLYEPSPGGHIPQVVFTQVKEKFSGLRIYASGGDEHTQALIRFAESISMKTCEVCGRMDETVGRNLHGWSKTTCIEHTRDLTSFSYNDQEVRDLFESINKEK